VKRSRSALDRLDLDAIDLLLRASLPGIRIAWRNRSR